MSQFHIVRMDRLWALMGGDEYDPWHIGKLPECEGEDRREYSSSFAEWTAKEHQQRINYLKNHEYDLDDPINIDFEFSMGIPEMIIEDGNHRYFAHLQLKKTHIRAYFGGFVDVLEYLTGETDTEPHLDELWV